jgi:Xaa-Pro aminopeptidase
MVEAARRRKAMQAARLAGAEAILITHAPDVRYLSGFTGSNGAVALAGGQAALFTDGRYTSQAKAETHGLRVVVDKKPVAALAVEWLLQRKIKRCAFDAGNTSVAALETMRRAVPAGLRRNFFLETKDLVATLREVKDAAEIIKMRRAAALGCSLFEGALQHVVAGSKESEVAAHLEFEARMAGAEAMSFGTIIASGLRSALPHGIASNSKIPRRGFVTMDFGVVLDGYCSDMTRTVHLGKGKQREWDVYHSVLEAQTAAVAAVAAGVSCGDVDEAARSVLKKATLAKWFSHSTGHGVGLEIHEGPRVAAKQEQKLKAGMVITIEPGVYLPGEFGVRIEDTVLVTEKGCEVLTAASPKAWIEL